MLGELHAGFQGSTPLWYYVLKEAELIQGGRRLGPVGGRIVAETILGLLRADPSSYLRAGTRWTPSVGGKGFRMPDLLSVRGRRSGEPRRVTARAAILAAVSLALAAGGCGGSDEHAGLTRDEADARIADAAKEAEHSGLLAERLNAALAGSPQEAMGRAGGISLGGGPKLAGEPTRVAEGEAPSTGEPAWVGSYALSGIGSALSACVYVWDEGSSVDVRADC